MNELINFLLIILLLLNLYILSSSSIRTCIKIVACEGFIIGLISIMLHWDCTSLLIIITGIITLAVKAVILPYLLYRALVVVNVKREMEPYISYTASIVFGIGFLIIGIILSYNIKFPGISEIYFSCPVALMTFLTGLMIIVSRRKAISQVLGYLVFENGIYMFGELLSTKSSLVIELGILLDVFVFIFIIGITMFHIRNEFNHIDSDRLTHLSDLPGKLRKVKK